MQVFVDRLGLTIADSAKNKVAVALCLSVRSHRLRAAHPLLLLGAQGKEQIDKSINEGISAVKGWLSKS